MNNSKISVIVPVYNVEQYLRKCLESILAQTYEFWEAILVDDGSSDQSGAICDEYANRDARFRVFHIENGGVSRARNFGIRHSCGDWLTFMDSDDWIEDCLFEILSRKISSTPVDCIKWGFFRNYKNGYSVVLIPKEICLEDQFENYKISERRYDAFVWNTLYKRKLLGDIVFDTSINWCEDHIFTTQYYIKCKSILWLNKALYHHRVGFGESLSSSVTSEMMIIACRKLAYYRHMMVGYNEIGKNMVKNYVNSTFFKAVSRLYEEKHNRIERKMLCDQIEMININSNNILAKIICLSYNCFPFYIKDRILEILFPIYGIYVRNKQKTYSFLLKYKGKLGAG